MLTASLPIASLLGTRPIDVVALGAPSRHDELSCVGPVAATTLSRYRFDLAVIGAAGISSRWGLTELDDGEAEIERMTIARADRVVVIADGAKVGTAANAVVADASRIRTLVTDAAAPSGSSPLGRGGRRGHMAGASDDVHEARLRERSKGVAALPQRGGP